MSALLGTTTVGAVLSAPLGTSARTLADLIVGGRYVDERVEFSADYRDPDTPAVRITVGSFPNQRTIWVSVDRANDILHQLDLQDAVQLAGKAAMENTNMNNQPEEAA